MRALAGIGYRDVELGSTQLTGQPLLDLRRLLDQFSMAAPSRQVPMSLVFSNARTLLNDCRILGSRQVVCEEVPAAERASVAGYRRVAELLNASGKITESVGVQLAVRVHAEDLKARGGVVPFDYLVTNTNAALVKFQIDLATFAAAARNPVEDFTRHRGRITSLRMGNVVTPDLAKALAAARAAGVQHFFVAEERPDPTFALAKQAFEEIAALKL